MALFSFFKPKPLLTTVENEEVLQAIRAAEKNTSGEIRVFMESHCEYMDPVDRAIEVFYNLKMDNTKDRNGVLIYVALKDRQLAIYADEGIHEKLPDNYWSECVQLMLAEFKQNYYVQGICKVAAQIGQSLAANFPYQGNGDKNELPDEIVFGK